MLVDYPCAHCGQKSEAARIFFSLNVLSVIELMEQYTDLEYNIDIAFKPKIVKANNITILILFCTLYEVLFYNLLKSLMRARRLPPNIQERLLKDNISITRQIDKLYPSLTGVKWSETITSIKCNKATDFYNKAARLRNIVIHKANNWCLPSNISKECIINVVPLLSLFVDVNNKYVAKKGKNTIK